MPRKRGGNRARAHKLEAPLDVEPYGTNMADVASQPLGIQPSALAIPTSTVSPCHDLAQNTLPNLALFQDSGLGFSSADIGLEETNSLPTSFSSTDHSIKRSHGSPDTVHTAPSEFQSFVKTASTSDDGEKSKLGSVDGSAKRRKTPKVASSTVPLLCSACPGQPQFSDLSHLLTHLGSRGHTKCEFDARVKASTQTDPAAMKAMVEYDLWFKENNISKMLANRMNDKEKKKQEREEGEVAKRKKGPNPSTSSKKRKTNEGEVKREPRENAAIRPAPVGEQFDFHGHGFDFTGNPNNSGSFDFDSGSFSLQPMPYFENDPALENARSPGISFLSDNESEHGNERMKLKGVYWPGMDMFDSATPENKKKRNQRKDSSVVARMMRESSAIQPTLMVCDRNMTIERTRDIYDSATEEEVMPKQPKAKRARTTASKPAIKKEGSVDTPKSASRTRKRQASSAGQAQVHGVTEARVKRGSAALAITKIAEQAQNDFDADLEDNLEEESDRDNDFSSRTRNRARPGRPSRMTQQWPLDLSRTNSSQSYHGSRSTTAGLDGFREDEGDSGVSQLKIEGQTESRSDITDHYMLCSDTVY
ncbi:hypothetical protein SODALDRAFT_192329 [Sodiomyces alkalinus F11]|uniref:Uncharacterized protein n=1 Tax=Sodiomyces alkalinus (strain CBS 110278 / VKM F-3762 / F11) TaxID=1314773 RepID=A0A3N2PRV8_SODAK|nr:hypothetical protein SODALDRAFT_192329 [Sodiomyces alkalinus F11]ROT37235.1 hypothetical protein SODALDRAFT_192329 [Sodiomyces alkalinus F11]